MATVEELKEALNQLSNNNTSIIPDNRTKEIAIKCIQDVLNLKEFLANMLKTDTKG